MVLRRYKRRVIEAHPDALVRCWNALEQVSSAGVPVPRPPWQDASGAVFGTPSLLMTHIAGRPIVQPRDVAAHAAQLGEALALIHRTPTERLVGAAPPQTQSAWENRLRRVWSDPVAAAHPRIEAIRVAFRHSTPPDPGHDTALIHGDFWPANVLWRRGRVVGIIDWEDAALDHPGRDVGSVRLVVALLYGLDAADACLDAYLRHGLSVADVPRWDVLTAVSAIRSLEMGYLAGYRDVGRTDLTLAMVAKRCDRLIERALQRIAAS